jgi:hypothetical protein
MLSFLFFILTVGIGIFGIAQAIDFCGYLQNYQRQQYEMITFERPFGIARDDFLIHPINPHKFIPYLFSRNEEENEAAKVYKKQLKLIFGAVVVLGVTVFIIPG